MGDPISSAIIQRIRSGDNDAFAELFHAHYSELVRFASALLGNLPDAEEVVSDTFLSIYERRAELSVKSSVLSYLIGAVRHRALTYKRDERRDAEGSSKYLDDVEMSQDESSDGSAGNTAVVTRALASLPADQRSLILLRWHQELSVSEIAQILGTTALGTRIRLSRALVALRKAATNLSKN